MARITCAISGIRFSCSYIEDISIPHTEGYFHPIFALPYKNLHHLYRNHCRGELTSNDSYLLFMAFLHSSGKVKWEHPATLNPNSVDTKKLIENNFSQLIKVLEKSALIKHPGFKQPSFKVTFEIAPLRQIPNWIKAWEDNIVTFNKTKADLRVQQSLQEIENKLTYYISTGEKPERYAHVIANWASEAAGFPPLRNEEWKKVIRSCFNIDKMFKTPLSLLKEIKDYCECNIEAGSIHFHSLSEALREGIAKHVDYLGGSSLALGYTLLPTLGTGSKLKDKELEEKQQEKLLNIATTASLEPPHPKDYPDSLSFLKAQLAFRVAKNIDKRDKQLASKPLATVHSITPTPKESEL